MVLIEALIYWSNFHSKVAVHSVEINSNHQLNLNSDPSLQLLPTDDKIFDNHSLKRQKRVLVFRPLHVYRQQQKEKQTIREQWKAEQELYQQQYQSSYEQQYYQQYLQNYYNQFAPFNGYYQPNYAYVEPIHSSVDGEQLNYNTGNYYTPHHQHTASYYYPASTISAHNPSQFYNSFSSDYNYD